MLNYHFTIGKGYLTCSTRQHTFHHTSATAVFQGQRTRKIHKMSRAACTCSWGGGLQIQNLFKERRKYNEKSKTIMSDFTLAEEPVVRRQTMRLSRFGKRMFRQISNNHAENLSRSAFSKIFHGNKLL